MKTIFVTTPDNIKVEYRLAGAGSRVGAAIVDTAIQALAFIAILLMALWLLFDFDTWAFANTLEHAANVIAAVLLLYFLIFFGYFLIFEIVMKGRTPGKKIFGLRAIRSNGQPITFIQSIIRNVIRVTIDNMGIGVIMMLLTKNHTRLGDSLAGTIVISENPGKYTSESLLWRPETADSESVKLNHVVNNEYRITYDEYEIIKDYFARRDGFIENGRYVEIRIREYFAEKFGVEKGIIDAEFLERVMTGYKGY